MAWDNVAIRHSDQENDQGQEQIVHFPPEQVYMLVSQST